jgi:hypothetical protein
MSQYITDPELLAELEGKKKKPSSKGYVTDPKLLAELNKPPEKESALQTLGRSTASALDTATNLLTGIADIPVRAVTRAGLGIAGVPLEQQSQILEKVTSPKDSFGRMFGVTETPGYKNEPLRSLGTMAGQAISENVINPIAQATNTPADYVGDVLGAASLAGPKIAGPAVRGTKAVAQGASDVIGGAVGRGTGYIAKPGETPVGYQIPSQRAPLRNTVMLPEDMAKFERGQMPYGQMPTEVPIQQLPRNFAERTALKMSGGEIPYQGQAARAFGERIGETYRNPFTAAIDVGSMFATGGVPLITAARTGLAGVQGVADAVLARRGLDPNLPTRLAEYQSGARPMPGTPPVPAPGPIAPSTSTALTVQGPGQQLPPSVIPMSGPQRNVNIEGQSFQLPNQINTANSQAARPQMQGPTPQQMAIQKTQEIVAQRQQQSQKVAGPVAPTQLPPAPQAQPAPMPQAAPATNPKPTTEVKNYGSVGLREVKEIEARAKETGEPIKYTYFRKGEGNTTVTLNKEIKFKPDPDLKLTSAKEFNNGNKEFYGVQTSTGSPVTVKFTKGKDIAVYDTNGKAIIKYDMTGKVIKD